MSEPPHVKHRHGEPSKIAFAIVTISTSRYYARERGEKIEDVSFQVARSRIEEKRGYTLAAYRLIPDDTEKILAEITNLVEREDIDVVVTIGGTGPSPTDVTIETIRPMFQKELEGFGQIFRFLSYQEIGSAAFLSNATAGIINGKVIFCLPGSPSAVRLAFEKLILPEVGHILALVRG